MGRKKIQIKPITDEKTRKVTFTRRRNGIFKKAYELGILCDTEVVVLMFDGKQMCHVYSSVESTDGPQELMQKYITKDFATVDPIRNYDTSPAMQTDDPAQPVWRVARERVAVVNTYNIVPATNTPNPNGNASGEEDDEADPDGSEQLSVKSKRTYHTKTGEAKFNGAAMMNTPALTDGPNSPAGKRSMSPESRQRPSPHISQGAHAGQPPYGMQQGLGISGSGFTPLLKPGEQFGSLLYPPQASATGRMQQSYWPTPSMLSPEQQYWVAAQASPKANMGQQQLQYFPNQQGNYGYTEHQGPMRYSAYDTPQLSSYEQAQQGPLHPTLLASPQPRAPVGRQPASFNNFTYPPPGQQEPQQQKQSTKGPTSAPRQAPGVQRLRPRRQPSEAQSETSSVGEEQEYAQQQQPQRYTYASPNRAQPVTFQHATPRSLANQNGMQVRPSYIQHGHSDESVAEMSRTAPISPKKQKTSRTGSVPVSPQKSTRAAAASPQRTISSEYIQSGPALSPPRRVTRSQSRSPELKARTLPALARTTSQGMRQVSDKENAEPMQHAASHPGKEAAPFGAHGSAAASIMAGSSKPRNMHLRGPSLLDDITFDPITGAPMMDPTVLSTWLGGASGPTTPVLGAGGQLGDAAAQTGKGLLGFKQSETSHVRAESNVSVSQWIHMPTVNE
ncbi:hypothetical protein BCR37DRAFT_394818 [Protomyces lactucae-debilis]|uniref:MADS-box domain-containing protein n=1 Tax=Protomyces lactucae-debilis TaxID=2754530 RepID=A0A1Y2F312_PROLT|nr:uncharacterized protein BCR37DRAFT_394818 [Protomyces lactucae-debilis]ORY77726.1 hypothetical protein BCR37DRAFT_394818 [Protomyces lactucae-debilis]